MAGLYVIILDGKKTRLWILKLVPLYVIYFILQVT